MAETRAVVTAPDRAPVQFGLFAALAFRENADRWFTGVTFQGQTCGPVSTYDVGCTDAPDEIVRPDREMSWGTADAFIAEGTFTCTPVGITSEEIEAQAIADLQRHEEAAVEQRLWGVLGADTDLTPLTTSGSPEAVLGALERHMALSYGATGVIHLPRHLVPFFEGLLSVRSGRLVTFLGTPVVAGAGYGEADGTTVYASPALLAYRSEVQVLGDADQMFDRRNNQLTTVAQRDYLVGYDTCPIASATVTVTL